MIFDNDPIDYNPSDCLATIELPVDPIIDALNPAIHEAKNYLHTKGFTNQEINNMILEENGQEEDLVPLVMIMTADEQSNTSTAFNYTSMFVDSSHAQSWGEIGNCAAAAVGADILYSLAIEGGGKSDKWKKKAIKKMLKKVASRMLGPVGVAIAVVSFGLYIVGA